MRAPLRTAVLVGLLLVLLLLAFPSHFPGTSSGAPRSGALSAASTAAPDLPVAQGWSMFHGNPELNGYATSSAPEHPRVLWTEDLPVDGSSLPGSSYTPFQSSPVVYHGSVLVPTADALYELNASTGAIEHAYSTLGSFGDGPYISTPTVTPNGLVGLSLGGGSGDTGVFDLATGTMALTCPFAGDAVASSLAPIPGGFLESDVEGHVNALSLSPLSCTGPTYNGAGGMAKYRATASVDYVNGGWEAVLGDFGSSSVDIWSVPTGGAPTSLALPGGAGDVYGSVAVANVTNGTNTYPTGFIADAQGVGTNSQIYAVNLTSGAIYPNYVTVPSPGSVPSGVRGTPAVINQGQGYAQLFVGNYTGNITAYQFQTSANGYFTETWNFEAPGSGVEFLASPVFAGGYVLDGATNGHLYCVNEFDGALLWSLPFSGAFYASPAVENGTVFAFTSTGELVAIALAPPSVTVLPPSPTLRSGGTGMVEVQVVGVNSTGGVGSGVDNAQVTLSTSGGTVAAPASTPTDAGGYAYFNWTAPGGTTSETNDTLTATVSAGGYAPAEANATAEVSPVPPTLTLKGGLVAASAAVEEGRVDWLNVTSADVAGHAVPGATVVLSVVGPGSLASSAGFTNGNGLFTTQYLAPATVPSDEAALVVANVSEAGYTSAMASVAIEVEVPASTPLPSLVVSVLPSPALAVVSSGTVAFEVVVASSSSGAPPVEGATATTEATPTTLGTIVPSSSSSSALGILYYNFSAGVGTGSVQVLFQVSASGYTSGAASLAIAVQPTGLLEGTLGLTAQMGASGPYLSGGTVQLLVEGTLTLPSGVAAPAAGVRVAASITAPSGASGLNSSTLTLSSSGGGDLTLHLPTVERSTLVVVIFSASETGYGQAVATLPLLDVPHPLALTATLSSAAVVTGKSATLTATATSNGQDVPGVWANLSVAASSTGTATLSPSSAQTNAQGVAMFTVSVGGTAGATVILALTASASGYASQAQNVSLAVVAAPSTQQVNQTSPSVSPFALNSLGWVLLALALVLLVLLIVALATRRRAPAQEAMGTGPLEARAPMGGGEAFSETAPPPPTGGISPDAEVHPHEYNEEAPEPEPSPVEGPPVRSEMVGPPVEPVEHLTEAGEEGTGPVHVDEGVGEGAAEAGAPAERTGAAEEPAPHVHVELERTLGEERPSVEEASPFGEELTPEEVNPNVRRIPKNLLQPAEMRISGDEQAKSEGVPEIDEAQRQKEQEERTQKLVEKSKRLRRVQRPPAPPPPDE